MTRLMAPLFPKASYSAIATSLMHAYLQAVQVRRPSTRPPSNLLSQPFASLRMLTLFAMGVAAVCSVL